MVVTNKSQKFGHLTHLPFGHVNNLVIVILGLNPMLVDAQVSDELLRGYNVLV